MYKRVTTICNASGLHARPASDFVKEAAKFTSKITIRRESEARGANAKSIVLLLSLGLAKGTTVEIAAEGPDERQAADTLVALIEAGCGEE